jgi:hypothetical protein
MHIQQQVVKQQSASPASCFSSDSFRASSFNKKQIQQQRL